MARRIDPTKFLVGLENLDLTQYDKVVLTAIQSRLKAILTDVTKTINDYDYFQEVAALKKKYNIKF